MKKIQFRWSAVSPRRMVFLSFLGSSVAASGIAFSQEQKPRPVAGPAVPPAAVPGAAKYDKWPIEQISSEKVVREKKKIKDEMLRGGATFNERDISEYYGAYIIPRMTTSPELCNDSRKEILDDITIAERSEAMLKPFNEWLLKTLGAVVMNNYHPAAGINSTLIIGRLNDSKQSSSGAPAKPMAAAAGPLLRLSVSGKNDGIRAAALDGLERHLRVGQAAWSDAQKQRVADELIKTLSEGQPAQRSNRAHAWLRGRALELLTLIKHKRQQEVYQFALDRIADKETEPLLLERSLRFIGANQSKEAKPEVAQVATTNALKYLVKSAKTWQEAVMSQESYTGGGGDGGDFGGQDMSMSDTGSSGDGGGGEGDGGFVKPKKEEKKPSPYSTQPNEVKIKRRELHQLLETVRVGLDGVPYGPVAATPQSGLTALLANSPSKSTLNETLRAIETLQAALNDVEIQAKTTLGLKTTVPLDSLFSIAQNFPGVSEKPIDSAPDIAPPEIPGENGALGDPTDALQPMNPDAANSLLPSGDVFGQ